MDDFLPGSFLVRNEALVIIDFETVVTVVVAGDKATLIPIGPSPGWPARQTDIHTHIDMNETKDVLILYHLKHLRN